MNSNRWEYMRLGDVCRTTSGGTPSRKRAAYFDGDIPWVKSGELPNGPVGNIEECISEAALKGSSAKPFPAGTLLIALYGATVGKLGILTRSAATNQAVCAIFPPASLDTRFLFWHLRFRREDLVAQAVGGAQPNISQSVIRGLVVPVPPLDRQHEIVAEIEKQFSRLDEAAANLKRVKANLKRYKAAVLKAAVEGRLVPTEAELARREGRSYETGAQLLQRILETRRSRWKGKGKEPAAPDMIDLPDLPTGWRWVSIEEIADRVADVDHKMPKPADSDIRYISTRDFIDEDGIDFKGAKCISQADYEVLCKKVRPEFGDILLSRYGTVGEVRVVNTERPFQASYSIAIIKSLTGFELAPYLTIALRSRVMQDQIKRDVRATAQPDLGLAHIRLLAVPLPPLAEQHRIVAEVDRHLSILYGVEAEVDANLKRAERLRQSVLGRVFAG